tara:strand:+ start:596 stop:895 length:300 start_codon:yes stop_codon:yes gene_type:complete
MLKELWNHLSKRRQRQFVYRKSDVLILDEATSALDNDTQSAFMDAIYNFDHNKTVIIIAHRLTTLKNCDMILSLGSNHQTEIMKYDEIMNLKENRGPIC